MDTKLSSLCSIPGLQLALISTLDIETRGAANLTFSLYSFVHCNIPQSSSLWTSQLVMSHKAAVVFMNPICIALNCSLQRPFRLVRNLNCCWSNIEYLLTRFLFTFLTFWHRISNLHEYKKILLKYSFHVNSSMHTFQYFDFFRKLREYIAIELCWR